MNKVGKITPPFFLDIHTKILFPIRVFAQHGYLLAADRPLQPLEHIQRRIRSKSIEQLLSKITTHLLAPGLTITRHRDGDVAARSCFPLPAYFIKCLPKKHSVQRNTVSLPACQPKTGIAHVTYLQTPRDQPQRLHRESFREPERCCSKKISRARSTHCFCLVFGLVKSLPFRRTSDLGCFRRCTSERRERKEPS